MVTPRIRHGLQLAAVMAVVSAAVFGAFAMWSSRTVSDANIRQALSEARTLNAEIGAAWEYVDSIQDHINYNHGVYDFKGVYCASAAKQIARHFSDNSDYSIRYVRLNPRLPSDLPDAFEERALELFAAGEETEYYEMAEVDGEPFFRYASKLEAKRNCLECHGSPAGELDEIGFVKEGMELGDVAGAVSIVMPMRVAVDAATTESAGTLAFYAISTLALIAIAIAATGRLIAAPIMSENEHLIQEKKAQSDFLSIVTHELKTPLSSIIAYTDILKRSLGNAGPEAAEATQQIANNSSVLLNTVSNVLDTARIENGRFHVSLAEMDMVDVLAAVRSSAEPLAEQAGIDLEVRMASDIPIVVSDREMLRRITLNLVANALRFTSPGGEVDLEVSYDGNDLLISVSDTGVGIGPERQEEVFERFSTTEGSSTNSAGGTGLGLSIVKEFSELLGGCVSMQSTLGKGSCFTCRIPAQACDEGEE